MILGLLDPAVKALDSAIRAGSYSPHYPAASCSPRSLQSITATTYLY
jgi:hypothetical protein